MDRKEVFACLSILAGQQRSKENTARRQRSDGKECEAFGLCLGFTKDQQLYNGIEVFSQDTDPEIREHCIAQSTRSQRNVDELEFYCSPKKMKLMSKDEVKEPHKKGTFEVNLNTLTAEPYEGLLTVKEFEKQEVQLNSGSMVSQQSFFPLAVDDYFMAVAILARKLGKGDEQNLSMGGACIVSNDSLHVVSVGYCQPPDMENPSTSLHAELVALLNAKTSKVDLATCSMYTTSPPCIQCTDAILQSGLRIVVYGPCRDEGKSCCKKIDSQAERVAEEDCFKPKVLSMVYDVKACFKKYKCLIRINDEEKKFLIHLPDCEVKYKKFKEPTKRKKTEQTPEPKESRPSYTDFFMAMAFFSHTRTKDNNCKVGACLVTPSPHRVVAMGYNGMPDGRGFQDDKMDWGSDQSEYICHAELNVIITAFRREADISDCTLYVTHSPCKDCCKLVAQAGIKNLVFAKYYKNGDAMYKTLGRLRDMNITRYEYMEARCRTKPKIIISLKNDLSVTFGDSRTIPQTDWGLKKCRLCLNDIEETNQKEELNSGTCPLCNKQVPILPEKKGKGRRDVDFPKDDYFMAIAVLAKSRSEMEKRVGACIVYHEPCRPISVGYNGDMDGLPNEKEKCCAEMNAIVSAYRYHADLTSATLYTTGYPCSRCATLIVQSGIKTVVYGNQVELDEKDMEKKEKDKVEEIFYWKKVATLKYRRKTPKSSIEIDLKALTVFHENTRGKISTQEG